MTLVTLCANILKNFLDIWMDRLIALYVIDRFHNGFRVSGEQYCGIETGIEVNIFLMILNLLYVLCLETTFFRSPGP